MIEVIHKVYKLMNHCITVFVKRPQNTENTDHSTFVSKRTRVFISCGHATTMNVPDVIKWNGIQVKYIRKQEE